MPSKSQIKLITSLKQKKYRDKTGLFVAEGPKVISELLKANFILHSLFSTNEDDFQPHKVEIISSSELKKISFLTTPYISLALFEIPSEKQPTSDGLKVALDAVRDPGNLGTIIRLCDWFGVKDLICSNDTVDCFNPKVIQATMGSIARVNVCYGDLPEFIKRQSAPAIAAVMDGDNVYTQNLPENAILVLGNEANGISKEIIDLVTNRITIPQFGDDQTTESLNVAAATAILLSEFNRAIEK